MTALPPATVWARATIDELARAGLRECCIAPGSRSTPLVLAAARHGGLHTRVFLDERSAGFFALGIGKATGTPAAVITTSGTAAANLLPAVVEASLSETPLLVLTADRPPRLRGADANQTIEQANLFASHVLDALDLGPPLPEARSLVHLRAAACRAFATALGVPAGPVHLNLPFEKPLEPQAAGAEAPGLVCEDGAPISVRDGRPDGAPWVAIAPRRPRADASEIDALVRSMERAHRGVLVAGPHPAAAALGPRLRSLAAASGNPLLADPLSGGRYGAARGAAVMSAYDLVLGEPAARARLQPDLVLRVGRAPTSAALQAWLSEHADVPQVVIDAGARWKDHLGSATSYLRADPVDALERLAERLPQRPPGPWSELWRRLDGAAARAASEAVRQDVRIHEGAILAEIVRAVPAGAPLFVSSSMPIRDLDAFGGSRDVALSVHGNRGASGIDGAVSTALGLAAGTGAVGLAVLGDLALLHDVGGLLATREADARVVFVIVNNDGGGIFHMLPVRDQQPEFLRLFATPHGLDLEQAAKLYRVDYARVGALSDLGPALAGALARDASVLLEVRTDREENRLAHEAAQQAAARAVRDALAGDGASTLSME